MFRRFLLCLSPLLLLAACGQAPDSTATAAATPINDPQSFSNPDAVRVTHLDLDLTVNFDAHVLSGQADVTVQRDNPAAPLVLDTRALAIEQVEGKTGADWQLLDFALGEEDPVKGRALTIPLPADVNQIRIHYRTSPQASGLQWLDAAQTAGKQHPFLFTQSQAIHARSWVPLQDTPQVRFTYTATIHTDPELKAVMSAENDPADHDGTYTFIMPQAIPSYLMALGVGDLQFAAMSERTGVYAEPAILEAAAWEFADTEQMMKTVEQLYGPYRWGRYDLLILPPSFPFGGMENPRLSFITPTVIAGDRSLVSLIAHELAHSWSGNLVTNATWRDLWLNEGFTTYLTYRIMEAMYGPERAAMERVLGYQSLQDNLANLAPADTVLAIKLEGRDPDAVFSDVPYEKGSLFLTWLEQQVGREAFDDFLRGYFAHFSFQSISTEQFLSYLQEHLLDEYDIPMATIEAWVYEPGLPEQHPVPQSDAFTKVAGVQQAWLTGETPAADIPTANWTTHEWLYFLNTLPAQLSAAQLEELDNTFVLTQSGNAEIAHAWLLIAIHNHYQPAYDRLEDYLIRIGRRKLIVPLYVALMQTEDGTAFAHRVYAKARPGYHPLAQGTLDGIVGKP